ncbi:MAG: MBL fold metallo-hydrolase [Akkermansiaceae bacterium]
MSLEDEFSDVVGKAIKGLELEPSEICAKAGVTELEIKRVLGGDFLKDALLRLAPHLELDAEPLVALPNYLPSVSELVGVRRFELPFHAWTVNAWHVEKDGTTLLFDTGWGKRDILGEIDPTSLDAIFITHEHPDHIGGLDSVNQGSVPLWHATGALAANCIKIGPFEVSVVDLSGHFTPAVGYFVNGLEQQLFVVGDAIFAGSAGGCENLEKFRQAFRTLRKSLKQADDGCLILPGHGPITSVANEKARNPFRRHFS